LSRLCLGIDASRSFGAQRTGTEHYATEITRRILSSGRYDCRLYFREAPREAPPGGAEAHILPARRLWTHRRLAAELRRRPPDLLFVPAHVLPIGCKVPAVVTVHDLGYEFYPRSHPLSRLAYLRWSTRRHAHLAAGILVDAGPTRDALVARYGADPERIDVVHLAADPDFAPAAPEAIAALRHQLSLPESAPYLLHVGTIQPRKNLERLLRAFAQLLAIEPELRLILAGAIGWGAAADRLREEAHALGIGDRLLLPGYLPRDQLPVLYSGATALVLPSLYEGFGLPMVEAMACGTAVACSEGSCLTEVAGEAALLFDPLDEAAIAEALRRMMVDTPLRRGLEAAGLARAAEFSWDRAAEETMRVLDRVGGAADSAARK
jgi:glycosyltransferase involved in cell wall biosynthesis